MSNFYNKKGFTLAELLIAMFIFGLVATMLVPNVTGNAEKSLFTTQLKKVQNDVQQGLLLIMSENQGTLQMVCGDKTTQSEMNKCFRDELVGSNETNNRVRGKIDKIASFDCSSRKNSKDDKKKDLANPYKQTQAYKKRAENILLLNKAKVTTPLTVHKASGASCDFYAANLKNGATISVVFDPTCNTVKNKTIEGGLVAEVETDPTKLCGYMEVDLNTAGKGPNTVGKDIHYFWILDKDGLVPFGELDNFTCGSKKVLASKLPKSYGKDALFGCTYRAIHSRKGIDYY